jgi:hypothetical protein
LNCMETLTEVVSKHVEFSVYEWHAANQLKISRRS